jgi:hypothetical protein
MPQRARTTEDVPATLRWRKVFGVMGSRTCDDGVLHVANVVLPDSGGLRRTIRAGHRVIHTVADDRERRWPRDGRWMSGPTGPLSKCPSDGGEPPSARH